MFDVVIVGGGPAGLSAALVLGRCRRRVLVCDDGRPRNAQAQAVHNFLTREGTPPDEMLRIARAQLRPFDVEIRRGPVRTAAPRAGGFEVRMGDGRRVRTRKLLLATGIKDVCPDIAAIARFIGRGVYYCSYCDGYTVRDRPLAALGSGVDGADLALALTTWSKEVVLCTNGAARPTRKTCERLARYGIPVRSERILRVEGRQHLEWIVLGRERLRCEGLFIQNGCVPRSDLAAQLGCAFTRRGAVTTRKGQRTTVDSVFVAGDA
ncbi:MAG: NAD(P)/FAD-dependent oxidoreductase, partial [Candidatus Binatia bacterium]